MVLTFFIITGRFSCREIFMARIKALYFTPFLIFVAAIFVFSYPSRGDNGQGGEEEMTCPESCESSRQNCELSCSQIVGGGAKTEKRRECYSACADELGECNRRCANPTPRPTLKPKAYHDKSCPSACEFKRKDCNEACTKYSGGGAKSAKKTACINECSEKLDQCKDWCVNPTQRPTRESKVYESKPCAQACRAERLDCEATCTMYIGGGAEGGKRAECMNRCGDVNDKCMSSCTR